MSWTNNLHKYDHQVTYEYFTDDNIDKEKILNLCFKLKRGREVYMILFNSIGHSSNFDSVNNLSVDRLLNEIAILGTEDKSFEILEEQLMDMKTGMCPAGRSLRLVQVLKAWR